MIDLLILLTLCMEVFLLIKFDRIIYGTWITPFSLLAFPYVMVVMAAFFFAPLMGFVPLYAESVLVWMVGLFFFWLAGSMIALPLGRSIRAQANVAWLDPSESGSEKPVLILAWIAIFVLGYGLLTTIGSLGWQIGSAEFDKAYGFGFFGHVMCFARGLVVFMIGTVRRKNKFTLLPILLLIALLSIYSVVAWTLIPILAGLIYRVSSNRSFLSMRKFAAIFLIGLLVFLSGYVLQLGMKDYETLFKADTYESLMKHFCSYIFSGVLGLGVAMKAGISSLPSTPLILFDPFVNLYAVIFSTNPVFKEIAPMQHLAYLTLDGIKTSNVHTFFGTILIHLGVLSGLAYALCLGALMYGLFALARISRNCWLMVAWVFVGAVLFFGWFDYYFWLLASLEIPVYCLLIGIFYHLFGRKSNKRWHETNCP